jgi:hypothetical protein
MRTADLNIEIDINAEVIDGHLWFLERIFVLIERKGY